LRSADRLSDAEDCKRCGARIERAKLAGIDALLDQPRVGGVAWALHGRHEFTEFGREEVRVIGTNRAL
jgi:hypothetical protein